MDEELNGFNKFLYWLDNIFWFHHKWKYLLGVFVLAFIAFILIEVLTTPHYDFTVVYAHSGAPARETVEQIRSNTAKAASALNGGKDARVQVCEVSGEMTDTGPLYMYLGNEENVLYIVDDYYYSIFDTLGYFEPLADYGGSGTGKPLTGALTGLRAAMNVIGPQYVSQALEDYAKFTDEELADVNNDIKNEYDALVAAAADCVTALSAQ